VHLFKIVAVLFALGFLVAAASAQIPSSGNVFFGYSYLNANLVPGDRTNLNGWEASVEGKVFPFVGVVADFSGHYGSQGVSGGICPVPVGALPGGCILTGSVNVSQHDFLFGPRVSFSVGKFRPFAHVLIGLSHLSDSETGFSGADNSFADAIGGGIDYHLMRLVSWRIQGDDLQTRFSGNTQNDFRLSTGIAVHF